MEYTKKIAVNGLTIDVRLNQIETDMVAGLPEALRQQVADSLLNAKAESQATLVANRTTFSVKINEAGTIVIRGLGNRFPTGMRPDSLETLLSHADDLKKAVAEAKAYIAANPEKVAAAQKTRNAKRAEARKLTLVAPVAAVPATK